MPIYEFAPDTGHESDYRAVGSNGLYLKPRPTTTPSLPALIASLEKRAQLHDEGSYGYRTLMGHAARHRATLAAQIAPVIDEAVEPEYQPTPAEMAEIGCAGVPVEEAEQREVDDDDGAYYGETAEEAFQRD